MTVTLRPGNKFWHYRFMFGGRLYQGTTKQTNQRKAELVEAGLIAKVMQGDGDYLLRKAPRLDEFAKRFLLYVDGNQEIKDGTREYYRFGWGMLSATSLARVPIDKIGTADAAMLKFPGVSGSTANNALRTLRRILGYAAELNIIKAAPKIGLRDENERITLIAPWLETLLLEHASPVLHDVLIVMLDCGMRPEEVGRMEWDHIHWSEETVYVPIGKTLQARRQVPLTDRMRHALAGARARNEKHKRGNSPYVFPSPRNAEGHMQWFSQVWARTIERVTEVCRKQRKKLPAGLVLYSARHTFATNYLRAGGDIGQLSRIMGHSDIRTTMRYVHLLAASDAAKIMNAHNEGKLEIVRRQA